MTTSTTKKVGGYVYRYNTSYRCWGFFWQKEERAKTTDYHDGRSVRLSEEWHGPVNPLTIVEPIYRFMIVSYTHEKAWSISNDVESTASDDPILFCLTNVIADDVEVIGRVCKPSMDADGFLDIINERDGTRCRVPDTIPYWELRHKIYEVCGIHVIDPIRTYGMQWNHCVISLQ